MTTRYEITRDLTAWNGMRITLTVECMDHLVNKPDQDILEAAVMQLVNSQGTMFRKLLAAAPAPPDWHPGAAAAP